MRLFCRWCIEGDEAKRQGSTEAKKKFNAESAEETESMVIRWQPKRGSSLRGLRPE
jgi:hypothetical protein